jgi:hypothetical protein
LWSFAGVGHNERLKIVATATPTKPEWASQWSHALLAQTLTDMGISASQVGRILGELDIKPNQVRSWVSPSRDTRLTEGVADGAGIDTKVLPDSGE